MEVKVNTKLTISKQCVTAQQGHAVSLDVPQTTQNTKGLGHVTGTQGPTRKSSGWPKLRQFDQKQKPNTHCNLWILTLSLDTHESVQTETTG